MIQLSPAELALIREIFRAAAPDLKVFVFGSRTGLHFQRYSDVDLLLKGENPLPLELLSDLEERFDESNLPYRVDLIDWHGISESFRQTIEGQCEDLFDSPKI